jgi:zinc-finger of a C2HC-type
MADRVTFRPETAVLVRSILDTERLNRLGVDMAETRKDFFNSSRADFILPSPRQPVSHLMAIRRTNPAAGQDTRKRHSHSLSRSSKNVPLSPIKSRSVEHHGCCLPNNSSRTVPQPCTSCQRSDLPERFHSHLLTADNRMAPNPPDDVNWTAKSRGLSNLAKLKKKFTWSRKVTSSAGDNKDDSGIGSSDDLSTHRSTAFYTISLSPKTSSRKSPVDHVTKVPEEKVKQQPFLLCYLCGRMFGSASLKIHQPQCLQVCSASSKTS